MEGYKKIGAFMFDGRPHQVFIYETIGGYGVMIKDNDGGTASTAYDSTVKKTPVEEIAHKIAENYVATAFRTLIATPGVGEVD
jgi:hypothetical protein